VPVCELDASGNVVAQTMFGAQGLVSRNTPASGTVWYAFDERGNVAQRTGSGGGVVSSDLYDAFGNVTRTGGPDVFGFGGQAGYSTDTETGLILCTNRHYDPQQGRFLSRDPLGYGGGINLYSYTQNNPVNRMDPTGFGDWGDTNEEEDPLLLPGQPAPDDIAYLNWLRDRDNGGKAVSKINNRWPINSKYAGQEYPLPPGLKAKYPDGVRFKNNGFPNFSPHATRSVKVKGLIGDDYEDFKLANKAAGFKRTPQDSTWHHHDDGETMELVPTDLHQGVRHTGGAAIIRCKK